MIKIKEPRSVGMGTKLLILGSLFFLGLFITTVLILLLQGSEMAANTVSLLRTTCVLQDLLTFIMPAFLFAAVASKRPFTFLDLDTAPSWKSVLFAILIPIAALPMMNMIIEWNEAITFPSSMQGIEQWMRQSEDAAKSVTEMMLANMTPGTFIANLLVVAVLAGLSEEIFFRGALSNLFLSSKVNRHATIWFTAFIFSAIHFQFYGFIPRLLMGAMFGYFVLWSGSIWPAVIAHVFNNASVVIDSYFSDPNSSVTLNAVGTSGNLHWLASLSLIATMLLIYAAQSILPRARTSKPATISEPAEK